MFSNANFNRVCDMFPVDLGVDLGALQPEIAQCKLRFQREVWNVICDSVLKNGQGGAWKKDAGGDESADTKEPPKEDEEESEQSGENENNYYAKNWSKVGGARRESRGMGGRRYPQQQPLLQQPQAAGKTWANEHKQHHNQAAVDTAAVRGYSGYAANRRAPPQLRLPPPPPAPAQQQQQQFPSPEESAVFLNRIHPQKDVFDWRIAPKRWPSKIVRPPTVPVPVSSWGAAADVGQKRLPSSAVRRRDTLGCQLRPVELLDDDTLAGFAGPTPRTVDSDGAETLEAANLQAGTPTSASRDFVPLIVGDWFAARRPQRWY